MSHRNNAEGPCCKTYDNATELLLCRQGKAHGALNSLVPGLIETGLGKTMSSSASAQLRSYQDYPMSADYTAYALSNALAYKIGLV